MSEKPQGSRGAGGCCLTPSAGPPEFLPGQQELSLRRSSPLPFLQAPSGQPGQAAGEQVPHGQNT